MSEARKDELDIDRRTKKASRNAWIFLMAGLVGVVLGAMLGGAVGAGLLAGGVFAVLIGVRMRRMLGVVGSIRAATQANARADHAQLEALLAAELGRGQAVGLKLPILEMLTQSLFRRGAMAEIDAVLSKQLGEGSRGDRGALADSYARLYSIWALARASIGAASVEPEAARIESSGAMDSRAATRLMLARAICAARAKDSATLVSVLEPLERVSMDATMQERALGRALRALGERGELVEGYRAGSAAQHRGPLGQWVSSVFASAAPFVDEQSSLAVGESTWSRVPEAVPAPLPTTRAGRRPLVFIQRWTTVSAAALVVLGFGFVTYSTLPLAFALAAASLVLSLTSIALAIGRRVAARKQVDALRKSVTRSLEGRLDEAVELVTPVIDARDPVLSALALMRRIQPTFCERAPSEHLADLELAVQRLAWLPSAGANTLVWANAVLWRPQLLAMAGREAEAEAALAFALKTVIEVSAGRGLSFMVRFWTALAQGKRELAIEHARSFDANVPIDGRTEFARDIVLALGDPSASIRIRERMRRHPRDEALLRMVCPWLLDALAEGAATGVRVEVAADRRPESESAESRSAPGDLAAHDRGGSTP
jgi:hypothetical protein